MSTNTYTQTSFLARGAPLRVGRGLNAAAVHRYMHARECGCVHARTHAHTHTQTHTHTTTHALILSPAKGQGSRGEASAAAIDTGSHGYTHAPEAASAAKGGRPAAGPPGGAAGA